MMHDSNHNLKDPHGNEQEVDLQKILSGKCPRCDAEMDINRRRPRVGAPDDRIECLLCGYTFDLSKAASYRLGDSDVDLKLQSGWITALRSGRLPNFTIRRGNGDEVPLSDWLRNTGTVFRACNIIVFILMVIIAIIIFLWK